MMKKLIHNLWFDWFLLTLVDLFTFVGSGETTSPFHFFNPLIGLFVPITFRNIAGIFDHPKTPYAGIYVLLVFILVLLLGNLFGKKYIKNYYLKVLFNVIVLFLLTFSIDMIIWHHWQSWQLIAQSVFDISTF